MKGRRFLAVFLALALLAGAVPAAAEEEYRIAEGNQEHFMQLLMDLYSAYRTPSPEDAGRIEADLDAIRSVRAEDGEIAGALSDHWAKVYLDPDYTLCLYQGGKEADELAESGLEDSGAHAFVVLGFELKDGKMTKELKGRCDAAAAAARSYPDAILVCSGGATGENNPKNHTEAGLMKRYLVKDCGIDESRILIDEKARTTLDNAVNTFRILREQGIRTFTVVTSSYHQRWGQVLYCTMAAICRQESGYSAEIAGDYSFEIEPKSYFRDDAKWAVTQLAGMLQLPKKMVEKISDFAEKTGGSGRKG